MNIFFLPFSFVTVGRAQRRRFHRWNVRHRCQVVHATAAGEIDSIGEIGSRTQSHHTDRSELFKSELQHRVPLAWVTSNLNFIWIFLYCSHCQRHRHRQPLQRHRNARYRRDRRARPNMGRRKNCWAIEQSAGIYSDDRKVWANCFRRQQNPQNIPRCN